MAAAERRRRRRRSRRRPSRRRRAAAVTVAAAMALLLSASSSSSSSASVASAFSSATSNSASIAGSAASVAAAAAFDPSSLSSASALRTAAAAAAAAESDAGAAVRRRRGGGDRRRTSSGVVARWGAAAAGGGDDGADVVAGGDGGGSAADWNGYSLSRRSGVGGGGFDDDRTGRSKASAVFDGRKSPFGSAALGKRRRPPLVSWSDEEDDDDDDVEYGELSLPMSTSSDTDDASSAALTADLLLRRDRALLALQQHLGLNTTASLSILTRFPSLYDSTECPSLSSKLLYLLNVVNLPKKRLTHMILAHPTLTVRVILDSETSLVSTIEVLQTELGLTSSDILTVSSGRLPAILGYDRSELRRRIHAYRHDLGYPPDLLKRMVLRDPEILRTDGSWVKRSAEVLGEELDMDLEDVHRMVSRAHLVLTYDPEGNVRPTVKYLKEGTVGRCLGLVKRKGVSVTSTSSSKEKERIVRERVREFVLKFPNVLALSVANNLMPTLDFFLNEVNVTELGLGKMLTRRPTLLDLRPDTMRMKLQFLGDEIGATEEELAEMAVRFPDLLSLSINDNLGPKIDYFRGGRDMGKVVTKDGGNDGADDPASAGLGMAPSQIRRLFTAKPQIFSLNLERNIMAKVRYLTVPPPEGGAGLTIEEVRHWFASYPQTVMCSLDSLIRPRMELVMGAGLKFRPLAEIDVGEDEDGDGDAEEKEEGRRERVRSDVPINFVWKPRKNWEDWVKVNVDGRRAG